MAGHSKWANVKFRKAGQDSKRGKLFTKLIREITTATRMGGGPDPTSNSRLRHAIDKALSANMSRDTVERAIKRGSGEVDGDNFEEIRYEGYGPGGVALIIDCLSDNRNRTVSEVRHLLTKHGGNLGTTGSVLFMFHKKGQLWFPKGVSEDALFESALQAGAEDVITHPDGSFEILTEPEHFHAVRTELESAGFTPEGGEVQFIPISEVSVDADTESTLLKLIDKLEDLDDVQSVSCNAALTSVEC